MDDETFMARAIEIAEGAKDETGALPYGAVVVLDGKIVGEGLNRAVALHDPTSHGEVEALRDACRNLKTTDLSGAVMYTTAEPCAMCVGAMLLANFGAVVYALAADQTAGFVKRMSAGNSSGRRRYTMPELRHQVGLPVDERDMGARRAGVDPTLETFERFVAARSGG